MDRMLPPPRGEEEAANKFGVGRPDMVVVLVVCILVHVPLVLKGGNPTLIWSIVVLMSLVLVYFQEEGSSSGSNSSQSMVVQGKRTQRNSGKRSKKVRVLLLVVVVKRKVPLVLQHTFTSSRKQVKEVIS